jgi:hypothetical protein
MTYAFQYAVGLSNPVGRDPSKIDRFFSPNFGTAGFHSFIF